jgi:SAM-dependent methyltransferase
MTETCDLCRSSSLAQVYEPSGSRRALKVYLCGQCGLVQSLPRTDRAPRRDAAVSSGADWGNVRYGKGFRTDACLAVARAHADFRKPLVGLDVGSNRGSFARAFLTAAPQIRLTCVEPDERVAKSCAGLERANLVHARIEETTLPADHFDIIHSCHTVEHLASPRTTFADHWRTLKQGGLLVVDAPNIGLIGTDDVLEEWFIDKHLYHFSAMTLACLIEASGFEILAHPNPNDRENLLFAAKKRARPPRSVKRNPAEAELARKLVATYGATRVRNLAALGEVAAEIAGLSPKRVALWGAGRLFDALVLYGGFDPKTLVALIDTHLKAHVSERHGVVLKGPEALAKSDPQVIVVMSRAFAPEIARIAKNHAPRADIVLYADLIARARMRAAA